MLPTGGIRKINKTAPDTFVIYKLLSAFSLYK